MALQVAVDVAQAREVEDLSNLEPPVRLLIPLLGSQELEVVTAVPVRVRLEQVEVELADREVGVQMCPGVLGPVGVGALQPNVQRRETLLAVEDGGEPLHSREVGLRVVPGRLLVVVPDELIELVLA